MPSQVWLIPICFFFFKCEHVLHECHIVSHMLLILIKHARLLKLLALTFPATPQLFNMPT
jgi:hypothetical protein